jgi:hypothetical protein
LPYDEQEYRLAFFLDNSFYRNRCKVCGEFFWSLDPSRDTCNESPCVEYMFLDRAFTSSVYTVAGARKAFIDFFRGTRPHPH